VRYGAGTIADLGGFSSSSDIARIYGHEGKPAQRPSVRVCVYHHPCWRMVRRPDRQERISADVSPNLAYNTLLQGYRADDVVISRLYMCIGMLQNLNLRQMTGYLRETFSCGRIHHAHCVEEPGSVVCGDILGCGVSPSCVSSMQMC
jgi:hypothetical protein